MMFKNLISPFILSRAKKGAMLCLLIFVMVAFTKVIKAQVTVLEKFNQFQTTHLQEKLFVHTDKTFYMAGETIWFKVFAVDAFLHRPLELSKVAYIEIISEDKKPVIEHKVELSMGTGTGNISIPVTASSGNYLLRCYTNWMKNFSPDFYFEKMITVANINKKPVRSGQPDSAVTHVQFFPEGGNLVYGLPATIAFQITDANGKSMEAKGLVLSQHNDTVAELKTFKMGMGRFMLNPQKGNQYTAILQLPDGKSITKLLPTPLEEGITMQIAAGNNREELTVTVSASSRLSFSTVHLFVHHHNIPTLLLTKKLDGDHGVFTISKKQLGDGISHFTVFSDYWIPVCERLVFKHPERRLLLDISTNKPDYKTREKIEIQVQSVTETGNKIPADLSLSVFLLDSLENLTNSSILSYLYLVSELPGAVENPEIYFDCHGTETVMAVDNLMLTHGWRRFKWEDILQNKPPAFKHLPESEGFLIEGKFVNRLSKKPGDNIRAYLSRPGKQAWLSASSSDASGNILFVAPLYNSQQELSAGLFLEKDSMEVFETQSPFSTDTHSFTLPACTFPVTLKEELLQRSISAQTMHTFWKEKNTGNLEKTTHSDSSAFYGIESKTYNLDDYIRFTTLQEVIQEYIPEIRLQKEGTDNQLKVKNQPYKYYFENEPLILLDGLPLRNSAEIIAFDPLKVSKIDIIPQKHYTGSVANEGIVNFVTYSNDLLGYKYNSGLISFSYDGLAVEREFYSPAYTTEEEKKSRTPDLRNTLFWKPLIKTGSTEKRIISFYSSDIAGTYAVVANALSADGRAGYKLLKIVVNK